VTGWEGTIVRAPGAERDDDFTAWLGRESNGLARFALFVTGNRDDAQDVLQDALAAIHPQYDQVAARGEVGAYARRAISNAAVSRWRKGRRHVVLADVDRTDPDHADQVTDSVLAWRLCADLPPDQRAAVVLRFYEDRSFAEIADILGCAEATARSHVHRAVAKLRTRFEGERP
jgi:RNA polymerase sigma-70 factor (sigma-E family)